MPFKMISILTVLASISSAVAHGQTIPKDIWGKWKIVRELPTRTISCWGEADVKKLLGTQIEYAEKAFIWNQVPARDVAATDKIVTAEQFQHENSSPSSNGSQVDFHQLGITAKQIRQISIHHDPADITGATIEIPGDEVLVKNPETLVFAVCNVYFEAKRIR